MLPLFPTHVCTHTHTHTHRLRVSKNMDIYSFPIMEGGLEGWSLIQFRKLVLLTSFWFSDSTDNNHKDLTRK